MKCVPIYLFVIFLEIITSSAGVPFTSRPVPRPPPEILSPFEGSREFSAPLLVTASTKPVTLPKIDKLSIKDVKLPKGITLESILSKIKSVSKNKIIDRDFPKLSSPRYKGSRKETSQPIATKLFENTPEFVKQNDRSADFRFLSSNFKDYVSPFNHLLASNIECPVLTYTASNPYVSVPSLPSLSSTLSPKSSSGFHSPLSLEFGSNSILPTSLSSHNFVASKLFTDSHPRAYSLPYPLYYTSTYLPKVSTPSYINSYEPPSSTRNFNSQTKISPTSLCYNTAKTVQVPVSPTNIPYSSDRFTKTNSWHQPSNPYSTFSGLSGYINVPKLTSPLNSPKAPYLPSNQFKSGIPLTPILSNSNINPYNSEFPLLGINDCPKYLDVENILLPDIIPIVDTYVETIETSNIGGYFNVQPFYNIDNVPSLQCISVAGTSSIPVIPQPYSFSSPYFGTDPISIFPPSFIAPKPCILEDSLPFSSPKIKLPSVSEISSNIVSSVNNVLTDITQNVVSNCKSYLSSMTNIPKISPSLSKNSLPIQVELPSVNIEKPLPVSYKYPAYIKSPVVIPLESAVSSIQPKVTLLPPQTIPTYSVKSMFCPSFLPSPSLPSYSSVSSPFFIEPSRIRAVKTEDEKQLFELMLIAEMLNEDENFDWDDLETLLALLYLS